MMQVSNINKVKETTTTKSTRKSSGADFSSYLRDVVAPSSETISGAGSVTVTDAIFAAQMIGEEEEKELRRQQIKRGQTLLEKLEEIRDGLLRGYLSKESLMNTARFVHEHKFEAQDERLNEIIEEIELRVEVELAKLMK